MLITRTIDVAASPDVARVTEVRHGGRVETVVVPEAHFAIVAELLAEAVNLIVRGIACGIAKASPAAPAPAEGREELTVGVH